MAENDKQQQQTVEPVDQTPQEESDEQSRARTSGRLAPLALGALGVVYGDLGTSPLYTMRASFSGVTGLAVNAANVLGILSLVFWSLVIVVSLKYLLFAMRCNNHGEGGILALTALFGASGGRRGRGRTILIGLGVFGAALLYGDAMITPAITVLSAIEGLHEITPRFNDYVLPITIVVLIVLFVLQRRGSGSIGRIFGPVMVLWFVLIAVLGIMHIGKNPGVLAAIDPGHAVRFLAHNQPAAFLALGGVVLCITGAEALYAAMGHFGSVPIRLAWFFCVLPALVLNYFGQGALLLVDPSAIENPFFRLAPAWALYPLVILATVAAVIASQGVISGVFSLTRQAVRLGRAPRTTIVQTSAEEVHQIYVPSINWLMMFATIGLVIGFRSSNNLASAYGVAITSTLIITSLLLYGVMRDRWRWSPWLTIPLLGLFLLMDVGFFSANIVKIPDGGWFPLLVAALAYVYMDTWHRGRLLLHKHLSESTVPLPELLKRVNEQTLPRVRGTAVFLTAPSDNVPPILLHHLEHNQVLHDRVILLSITTEEVPRVPAVERLEVEQMLAAEFFRVRVRYGFMQNPNIPVALRLAERLGLKIDLDHTTFYVGRETLIPSAEVPGMMLWRERLFAFISRNATRATVFYRIPPDQVIELGIQVEL